MRIGVFVYWLEHIILLDATIIDWTMLADWTIAATISPLPVPLAPRSLFVTFEASEDARNRAAFNSLTVLACDLDQANQRAVVSLLPVLELHGFEQASLRSWLVSRNWPAWARATHNVRFRLGAEDEPMLLAKATECTHIPLPTLQSAASSERLPTILAGDRQLVYVDTIVEAQQRGLLGLGRGRPRRGHRSR